MREAYQQQWTQLCDHLGDRDSAPALWRLLDTLYRHPKRAYHTIDHAADCVKLLHALAPDLAPADPDAAELALWLHDCVYVSGSSSNEEESAEIALVFCTQLAIQHDRARRIYDMIMGTRHTGQPLTGDPAIVADIDLSSLGSARAEFARGSAAIAKEFAHVPPDKYRAGRVKFLESMLARPRLFHTDFMRDRLEAQARRNVRIELERQLASGSRAD